MPKVTLEIMVWKPPGTMAQSKPTELLIPLAPYWQHLVSCKKRCGVTSQSKYRYRAEKQPIFRSQTMIKHKRAKGGNVCKTHQLHCLGYIMICLGNILPKLKSWEDRAESLRYGSACPLGVLYSIPILRSVRVCTTINPLVGKTVGFLLGRVGVLKLE